jgi:exopolysaccharide biosynthesis polyprenyl glycosylphosphotransferase
LDDVALFVCVRVVGDVAAVLLGFLVSYTAYGDAIVAGTLDRLLPDPAPYRALALLFAVIVVVVFGRLGLYGRRASVLNLWEMQTSVQGIALAAAAFFAALFFLRLGLYSRFVAVGGIAMSAGLVLLFRRLIRVYYAVLARRGHFRWRVLIYGNGRVGELLMKKIVQSPQLGWTVVGFLEDSASIGSTIACRVMQTGMEVFEASVLGRSGDLARIAERYGINELLISTPTNPSTLRALLSLCRERGIRVGIIPSFEDIRADQLEVEDVSAMPVLRPHSLTPRLTQRVLKRAFDLTIAPTILAVTAPIWIVALICVRLDSPGTVFFAQERVGLRGRRFKILKFRTMWQTAPKYARSPNGDVDPRITRVGHFLRRTGLDELPQLLNVISGEMSLVGPRPEMPFLVDDADPLQRQRLQVKPGITGLWQISVDRHAEIHENIEYDLYYVSHQSALLDALILLETLFFTLGLVLRPGWRREQNNRTVTLPVSGRGVADRAVVLALDQRRSEEALALWRRWVPAIAERCAGHAVQMLVAGQNVATFDEIIRQHDRDPMAPGGRVDYVLYDSQSDLRARVERAQLVITNLPNVGQWAASAGIALMNPEQLLEAPADVAIIFENEKGGAAPVRAPQQPLWNPVPTPRVDSPLQLG